MMKILKRLALAIGGCLLMLSMLVLALRATGVLRWFKVPTAGMEPTLPAGTTVVTFSYLGAEPKRGDMVIFETHNIPAVVAYLPTGSNPIFIKRLVGKSGETIEYKDSRILIDGMEFTEHPGLSYEPKVNGPTKYVVPPETCFLLGDNSPQSADSRMWGPVPNDDILGRAVLTFPPG